MPYFAFELIHMSFDVDVTEIFSRFTAHVMSIHRNIVKAYCTTHFDVSVDQPIQFNVIIVFAERIDENFSHLQPTHVEAKLDERTKTNK